MGIKQSLYQNLSRKKLPARLIADLRVTLRHRDYPEEIAAWVPEEKRRDAKYLRRLRRDIAYCEVRHLVSADEYFRYRFESKNDRGRHQYLGVKEISRLYRKIDAPDRKKLTDKATAYEMFKDFYRREQIEILSDGDLPAFLDFLTRHRTAIVKPQGLDGGRGVCRMDVAEGEEEAAFRAIRAKGECVVEEMIRQSPEMAKFHPGSVNTIRVVTCNRNGKVSIVQTSVRMGMGNSFVDNGCLSSSVDPETGIITSVGRSAHNPGLYIIHPDTGEQIIGNRIPRWDELLAFVAQLPPLFPQQRIIGWDLALAEDGWLMIEANSHPHMQTLAGHGVGIRPMFEELMK